VFFLFSGEGPTDLGVCENDADECDGEDFKHGPMAVLVNLLFEAVRRNSFLDSGHCGFVSKRELVNRASALKGASQVPRLPGKKGEKETAYFYRNARAFAACAKERESRVSAPVIAGLFRDSDGTASAGPWIMGAKTTVDARWL